MKVSKRWDSRLVSLEEQAGFGKTKQQWLCSQIKRFQNAVELLGSQCTSQPVHLDRKFAKYRWNEEGEKPASQTGDSLGAG